MRPLSAGPFYDLLISLFRFFLNFQCSECFQQICQRGPQKNTASAGETQEKNTGKSLLVSKEKISKVFSLKVGDVIKNQAFFGHLAS